MECAYRVLERALHTHTYIYTQARPTPATTSPCEVVVCVTVYRVKPFLTNHLCRLPTSLYWLLHLDPKRSPIQYHILTAKTAHLCKWIIGNWSHDQLILCAVYVVLYITDGSVKAQSPKVNSSEVNPMIYKIDICCSQH